MPNKIKKVAIENFRSISARKDFFFSDCHSLVGENATGKTSVLEAIDYATSSYASGKIHEQDFNADDIGDILIEIEFEMPFVAIVTDHRKCIPCSGIRFTAHRRDKAAGNKAFCDPFVVTQRVIPLLYEEGSEPDLSHISNTVIRLPKWLREYEGGYRIHRDERGQPIFIPEYLLDIKTETKGLPTIFYFGKDRERDTKVGFSSTLQRIVTDLNWRYRKKWNQKTTAALWEKYYNNVIKDLQEPKEEKIITPIREGMAFFLGSEFEGLELSLLDIEQPLSKAFFSIREGTNQIEQKRLGSGTSILMAYLLADSVSRRAKGESFIFLIDEPELHLHPQVQRKLFRYFDEDEHQVIYTTHSESFINISEWHSITRISDTGSVFPDNTTLSEEVLGQSIRTHLDDIQEYYQYRTIFFEEDNQLFFAKKCLLVEGPIDKYGIPILSGKLDKSLGDLTIISCNGKDKMIHYQLLCKAYGIPFFCIFDLDQLPESDTKNSGIISVCDEQNPYFAFTTSFEAELGIGINSRHKASKAFEIIDLINPTHISREIKEASEKISNWSLSANNVTSSDPQFQQEQNGGSQMQLL